MKLLSDLNPNELDHSFCAPNDYAKFHQNRPKIATRQTDASDIIICPMLCYSNRTEKHVSARSSECFSVY